MQNMEQMKLDASALKQEVQEVKAKKENQSFLQTWKNSATLDGPLHYKSGNNAGERQGYECKQKCKEHLDAHSSGYKWDSKRGYLQKARQI